MISTNSGWFLGRVYRVSSLAWLIGCVFSLITWGWEATLGWTLGSVISGGVVRGVEVAVRAAIVPGMTDAKGRLARYTLLKMVAVAVAIVVVLLVAGSNVRVIFGMVAGLMLVQTIMLLLGILILLRGKALE